MRSVPCMPENNHPWVNEKVENSFPTQDIFRRTDDVCLLLGKRLTLIHLYNIQCIIIIYRGLAKKRSPLPKMAYLVYNDYRYKENVNRSCVFVLA